MVNKIFLFKLFLLLHFFIFVYILLKEQTYKNYLRQVLTFKGDNDAYQFLNIVELSKKTHHYEKGILNITGKNLLIFIYEKSDYISYYIAKTQIWEREWLDQLLFYMEINSKAQLIDLGCNLGVYTLTAAAFGRNVIAIDANRNNTDRLVQSVIENNFTNNVIVILNAISNVRMTYSMNITENNIGGQYLIENKLNSYSVKSILINDLMSITNEKDEFIIKIDIQGSEIDSILASSHFFSERNVIAIIMEWIMIKESNDCGILIDFLMKRNYLPYADFYAEYQLLVSDFNEWPYNIVWKKMNQISSNELSNKYQS